MSKFCDKCGAEVKDGDKFCDKCGNKVNMADNVSSASTTYSCPYCGQEIPYSTRCPKCGRSLKNDDAAKVGLGIIGVIILFILITGICGFLLIIFAAGG